MPKALWLAALIAGCATETTSDLLTCEIQVNAPASELVSGAPQTLTGRPFTSILDTSVRFNDVDAILETVERLECTLCDACRVQAECTTCEACTECATSCDTCEESISFTVPELATGTYTVVVRNAYGMSPPTDVNVKNLSDSDTDTDTDTDSDTDTDTDTDTDSDADTDTDTDSDTDTDTDSDTDTDTDSD